jgi:ABC-type Fe3+-hydroxamate transport system substrate-binding protein
MVDKTTKDDTTTTSASTTTTNVCDTVGENLVRAVDEMAKVQPQFSQSLSNLQLDYIQTTKNTIQNAVSAQKQFTASLNIPTVALPYSEQFARQSDEIANNTMRTVGINSRLAINVLDAARENLKIYNRTIDAVTDFSGNVAKVWTSFFSAQQNQFFNK